MKPGGEGGRKCIHILQTCKREQEVDPHLLPSSPPPPIAISVLSSLQLPTPPPVARGGVGGRGEVGNCPRVAMEGDGELSKRKRLLFCMGREEAARSGGGREWGSLHCTRGVPLHCTGTGIGGETAGVDPCKKNKVGMAFQGACVWRGQEECPVLAARGFVGDDAAAMDPSPPATGQGSPSSAARVKGRQALLSVLLCRFPR